MNHFVVDGRYEDLLKFQGIDPATILKKVGLAENAFQRSTTLMKEEEYYRFLTEISLASNDPELPIKMATAHQIESFSPPIYAAWCSENGEVFIERIQRYKKLIGPMRFMITMSEEFETIEVVPGNELLSLPSFLVQSEFAFLIGLLRKATQKEINPIRIQMKDLPSNEIFAAYASCEIEKSHTNAITFAIQDLKQAFSSYNDAMWSYFEPEMKRRIAELEVDDSISARVKNSLVELLPQGNGIIEDVAEN